MSAPYDIRAHARSWPPRLRREASGCETESHRDVDNCGACGRACPVGPDSSTSCAHSTCYFACDPGFLDPATGCEVDPQTDEAHCGACFRRCGDGQSCVGGECIGPRRVFATFGRIVASGLGSLAAADAVCRSEAEGAGLAGTYLAWLSTDTESPATRFRRSRVVYRTIDGRDLATSWADLVDGTLLSAPNRTATGLLVPGVCDVITNTHPDGTAHVGETCGNLSGGGRGWRGIPNRSGSDWTHRCSGPSVCDQMNRLYCFEQ